MLPALTPSKPRRASPRRRLDLLVALLSLVVGVELAWFLGHTPVTLVTEGQADILLQGEKTMDGERQGELVPGPQPPHMAHGEGRDDGEPMPGVPVPDHGGQPARPGLPAKPGQPAALGQVAGPGRPTAPPVGVPTQPTKVPAKATRPPSVAGSNDPYHRMLTGLILLDARNPLDRTQARQLLDAIRAREALNGNDVAVTARTIIDALSPAQRAFVTRARDARVRRGKLPSAPELLPGQIAQWLEMTEKRAR